MPDSIKDILETLNTDPAQDDHDQSTAAYGGADTGTAESGGGTHADAGAQAGAEPDKQVNSGVTAEQLTEAISNVSAQNMPMMKAMIDRLEKIGSKQSETTAPAVKPEPPQYQPNPAFESFKESDPELYKVLVMQDAQAFEREQKLTSLLESQSEQIERLGKIHDQNLDYMENSVLNVKYPDAGQVVKSDEFKGFIEKQNPIVAKAYQEAIDKGTAEERVAVVDLFKKEQEASTEAAKKAEAAEKGPDTPMADARAQAAPNTLTDFAAGELQQRQTALMDKLGDPEAMEEYFAAGQTPEDVEKLQDDLLKAQEMLGLL